MELRQLHYALQIAREKNFTRAAEKLHIAQPSLSQQLAKLEKEIGQLLFQRNTNAVELTYAGTVFMEKAQKIVDMAEQLRQEMDDISEMRRGKLVVGSLPMTGSHILPLVLPAFQAKYPEIEISLMEETTANLETMTANGLVDICLLTLPVQDQALTSLPLLEEEICLAIPPQHTLASHAPNIRMDELVEEPFIVLKEGQGFRQITFNLCSEAGFMPKIVFESSNIETVQSLVAAGMGIAFVPIMVAREQGTSLSPVYLHFAHPRPSRTLVIAYRRGRYLSKAAEAFIATMSDVLKK